MVSFEEEFPSLKIKNMLEIGTYSPLKKCCLIEDIQESCVDKARLRDLITELEEYKKDIDGRHASGKLWLQGFNCSLDRLRLLLGEKNAN